MSDLERLVSPIMHNLNCANDRVSTVSISSSNCSQTSSGTSCSKKRTGSKKGNLRPYYKRRVRLPYTYVEMISMVLKSSSCGRLTLREITDCMQEKFACFRGEYTGWKNSVRHNLSSSECFTKIMRDSSRPYGKGSFWKMNTECEHCKNKPENDADCNRILTVNHTPVGSRSPSPASSESVTESAAGNQTKPLYHPTTEMSTGYQPYPMSTHGTNNAASEAYHEDKYYEQHSYTAHHSSRHQHRYYHPYTPPHTNYWQQGRYPATQQGTNLDDLSTIGDVPAHDINFSMYSNSESLIMQDQPQGHVPPTTMYDPTGFEAYASFCYPYLDYLPTPYQYPQDDLNQCNNNLQTATSGDNEADSYVHMHQYAHGFAQQICDTQSFPSSPSSLHSSDSSDHSVFAPAFD